MNSTTSTPLQTALRVLQTLQGGGRPHERLHAHVEVARAYAGEAAWASAEAHLERAMASGLALPAVDARVDLACELAEMACRSAESSEPAESADRAERGASSRGSTARRRARGHAAEAARLAAHVACPSWEIKVLLRISDVFDRLGNHDEAAELQGRAMRLMSHEMSQALASLAALAAAA